MRRVGLGRRGNVRIDTRWAAGDAERFRRYASELVALAPDVILASGGTGVGALLQASRTIPIVFTQTQDPVGAGYVDSLARPGGNSSSRCPLLAHSGHELLHRTCPLSGTKRTTKPGRC